MYIYIYIVYSVCRAANHTCTHTHTHTHTDAFENASCMCTVYRQFVSSVDHFAIVEATSVASAATRHSI